MEPEVERVLSDLGITQSRDRHGTLGWTLELATPQSGHQSQTAHFDGSLRKWLLDQPGIENGHVANPPHSTPAARTFEQLAKPSTHISSNDWTTALPDSDHVRFFRSRDWKRTPLGPCHTWSNALRLHVHMLFSDGRAATIYWGPTRTCIYNERVLPLLGDLHPRLMSSSIGIVAPKLGESLNPMFDAVEAGQIGLVQNGLEFSIDRHGYLEETWWDGSLVALKDDSGAYGGVYLPWVEVTRQVLHDRWTTLVNQLGQSSLVDSTTIWHHIHQAFADFPRDIPMAIIYGTEDITSVDQQLHLKYTIGTDDAYTAAPATLDLTSLGDVHPLGSLFRRAQESPAEYVVIDLVKESIPLTITANVKWLGYGEPSRFLVIIPLRVGNIIRGYVLLGLNPRRDLDADHEQFIQDLARQLRELVTKITVEERVQEREQRLMKELTDSERRISRMAEMAPVGIYDLGANGSLLWANSHFFNIMGVALDHRDPSLFDWRDYIIPEDQAQANFQLTRSLVDKVEISDSLRLKKQWKPPEAVHGPQSANEPFWVLYSASPDIKADGSVHSLMGTITDISHLKWAEQLQIRNADAAQREKQIQEEFIDITSHEMRNPLSAITQFADSIITSPHDVEDDNDAQAILEILKSNVDAAESILFCAAHQRRIIDDVLTLGKLDSQLLTITPISFHPISLVDEAMRMFKAEFQTNGIDVNTIFDQRSALGNASSVYGDSSRLMQILVNLLTNAIKFTRTQKTRKITIIFGSSHTAPTVDLFGPNFHWHSTDKTRPDLTLEPGYGQAEAVYIYYGIVDSGKGIAEEFVDRVFTKFEQADRRTHIKYGGSGLGLFISRELTEMQGGRIGIESKEAVGSTFAFYTKAKIAPEQPARRLGLKRRNTPTSGLAHDIPSHQRESGLSPQPAATTSSVRSNISPPTASYKVLLVEDNILNQKVLAKQLRKAGCVVHVANHGGEAIDFVLQLLGQPPAFGTALLPNAPSNVDCILMDWEMPVCDGVTATKRIREIEVEQSSPPNLIIGITANARTEQIVKARDAGMDEVVPKPFRVSELLAKINQFATVSEDDTA